MDLRWASLLRVSARAHLSVTKQVFIIQNICSARQARVSLAMKRNPWPKPSHGLSHLLTGEATQHFMNLIPAKI